MGGIWFKDYSSSGVTDTLETLPVLLPRRPRLFWGPPGLCWMALVIGFQEIQETGTFLHSLACALTQSCLTLCNPVDYSPPASSVHGIPRQEYWSGLPFPPPRIFPTHGLNPGLLHFRRIPYCPSQQGSPFIPLASSYSSWLKPRVLLQPNLTIFFFFDMKGLERFPKVALIFFS